MLKSAYYHPESFVEWTYFCETGSLETRSSSKESAANSVQGHAALGPDPLLVQGYQRRFVNINAKAEGIENKPAFRKAFERRRCLVPVDNFYEWKKTATGKQPYAIALADRGIMALAGLWDRPSCPANMYLHRGVAR
jgi:putative SOS response-associated peptidase YedK